MKAKIFTYSDGSKSYATGNMVITKPGCTIVSEEEREVSEIEHDKVLNDPQNSAIFKELQVDNQ